MYEGPHYYHQPGHNRHKEPLELLENNLGGGIILPYRKILKSGRIKNLDDFLEQLTTTDAEDNILSKTMNRYKTLGKAILIDMEAYSPDDYQGDNDEMLEGSKILLEPTVRTQYIEKSLLVQKTCDCSAYIIPNFQTPSVSPTWFDIVNRLNDNAMNWLAINDSNTEKLKYMTISVPITDIMDSANCQDFIDNLVTIEVDGFYLNITGIPFNLSDSTSLKSLMQLVFQLKLQQRKVILGFVGPWIHTMMPLGLDVFGNGGFKSQQTVKNVREPETDGGGRNSGGPKPYDVWLDGAMTYLQYPNDADIIDSLMNAQEKEKLYNTKTGYAPPLDTKPSDTFYSKGYGQNKRLNHFVATMALIANKYQPLKSLNERIGKARIEIREAHENHKRVAKALQDPTSGDEKLVWLEVMDRFVDEHKDYLEEMYS